MVNKETLKKVIKKVLNDENYEIIGPDDHDHADDLVESLADSIWQDFILANLKQKTHV